MSWVSRGRAEPGLGWSRVESQRRTEGGTGSRSESSRRGKQEVQDACYGMSLPRLLEPNCLSHLCTPVVTPGPCEVGWRKIACPGRRVRKWPKRPKVSRLPTLWRCHLGPGHQQTGLWSTENFQFLVRFISPRYLFLPMLMPVQKQLS